MFRSMLSVVTALVVLGAAVFVAVEGAPSHQLYAEASPTQADAAPASR